jgi:hypothetical protein
MKKRMAACDNWIFFFVIISIYFFQNIWSYVMKTPSGRDRLKFAILFGVVPFLFGCATVPHGRHADGARRSLGLGRELTVSDCAIDDAVRVSWLGRGVVRVEPTARLDFDAAFALDRWITEAARPLARQALGADLVAIGTLGSHSCRRIGRRWNSPISEHAYGRAIDIATFHFSDGLVISVENSWNSHSYSHRILIRELHKSACRYFTTALGPSFNAEHSNHFHFDRSNRNGRTVCQ